VALLGNLTGSSQFFSDELFYNDIATQSLRFDDGSSAYLSRTFSTPTNNKIWTFSTWVKRSNLGINYPTMFSRAIDSSNYFQLRFDLDSELITVFDKNANSNYILLQTTPKYRDTSSWYHILVAYDTTQSTSSDRVKLYVNGEQVIDFSTATYPAQNYAPKANTAGEHKIGTYSTSQHFDGYLSEVNFVDGQALTPSSFGETKNGVWIPIKYTGSYGTNGFRLQFNQTGVGTASTSTIGADTSGNTHHFTSSGIAASDCNMPDSPENNFPTMNALEFQENNSGAFLAEGNLKFSNVNANINSTFGFGNSGGKYYWEYLYVSSTDSNHYQGVTLPKDGVSIANAFNTGIALYFHDGTTRVDGTSGTGFGGQIGADNIIQFKLDLDNGTLQFGKNNTYISALTLPTSIGGWRAGGIQSGGTGGTRVFVANYGQDSSFAGNKTAQGNTDENGIGDFFYAPPSGFLAVCSANLPEPTIGPNSLTQADDHFNTVLYSGNGGTQNITGFGFQPDWIWDKSRNNTFSHMLVDSSRGVGKYLRTNTNGAEVDDASILTHFISDGVTVGDINGNASGSSSVMWGWKANGGTTSSNSDGSITSTVQANTTAGFSIVTATSPSSGTWSVGHGLSKKPDMIIQKYLASSSRWTVWHNILTSGQYLGLNESNAIASSGTPFNFNITDSVIGGNADYDATSTAVVYYVFHSVEGYSKIGVYNPNNTTDNAFVHTGFKPAMVILKGAEINNQEWGILDNKRPGYNSVYFLQPQSTAAESTSNIVDFVSNGFKIRETGGVGYLTSNYIYMAFAEAPFKYANAG